MTLEPDHPKPPSFGPMSPIPYRDSFDAAQYATVARGLVPRTMENKWGARFEADRLSWYRSWTGRTVYRVSFQPSAGRHAVLEASCAIEVLAGSDAGHEADLLDFLVRNLLLGERKPFPRPAGRVEPVPGLFQHVFSGTGFPERITGRKP